MFDPITLDQLRTFVTVVEEGSFSAAARRLRRVQSAVSTSMANLETQLGVQVWDRSTKIARLTDAGTALLGAARRVLGEMDSLRTLTTGLAGGVEARVSLCVDALFPVSALVDACVEFAREFPLVDLRVDTQTMSAVAERVASGEATLGVAGPLGARTSLERRVLAAVRMLAVVAPSHPLANADAKTKRTKREKARVPTAALADHVQIVLSERRDDGDEGVPDQAVLSPRTWRVADLHTKHAMLRAGLGWGNLPEHLVRADVAAGRLVVVRPEAWSDDEHTLTFSAVHRRDRPIGPAHQWLVGALERLCTRAVEAPSRRDAPLR